MPSINNKKIVEQIINNNGYYPDQHDLDRDPQVKYVHQYTTQWNGLCWHVSYNQRQLVSFLSSPCCHDIKLLWDASTGLQCSLSDKK